MTDDLMRLFVNELKAKDKDKDKYNDGNSLTGIRDTLVELDLSFNKLTTDGFRQILLYFLDGDDLIHDVDDDDKKIIGAEDSILSTFKVAGNKIRAEGARTLGRILRTNASLEALDLRMNLLNDEGGQLVMNGLQHNHTLKRLNMSCNLLSSLTAEGLCRVFEMSDSSTRSSNQLQHMDISSNEFKASDLIMLSQAVEQTCKLTSLDLRGNVFKNSGSKKITTEDALESINNKLKSNATHMKMQNR
jgi:Ran GTPase-activating protein (RanGAP) involved in mRNA processing and transport